MFHGRGKITCWNIWRLFPLVTDSFIALSRGPSQIDAAHLTVLEQFVVLIYDKTSQLTEVNRARLNLFTKQNRQIDNIPPTQAALLQHILRSTYQGGHVWGQCLVKQQHLPSPGDWGWFKEETEKAWSPVWTMLPEALHSCLELISCTCRTLQCTRCKCAKANLPCTALCKCGGECRSQQ